jgi:histidinol dehydrogenase
VPLRLDARERSFGESFARLVASARETVESVDAMARAIVEDVRRRGDQALVDYTSRFDGFRATPANLRVTRRDIEKGWKSTPRTLRAVLERAAVRIETFHRRQLPDDTSWRDESGMRLGWRWTALESVGIYVPGGRAAYPSSVLMNAVPARVAGVERIAMAVPTPGGKLNATVLAAARIAGVEEIHCIGGAQAIAALAYGTTSIAPVDKIVGPGNAFVAAAKRLVFGTVGIDSIAGPSEVVIVADAANDPAWIAADLMAQAEHDPVAQSILITDDARFADRVERAVTKLLERLPRRAIAGASWRDHGAVIVVETIADAAALVNRLAPEHLQLAIDDPESLAGRVRHAGAIFLGRHTPEALGDYVAGPSHVLPTSRTARFASGLGVLDFLKRSSLLGADDATLVALGDDAIALARAEGLDAHARSVRVRRSKGRR